MSSPLGYGLCRREDGGAPSLVELLSRDGSVERQELWCQACVYRRVSGQYSAGSDGIGRDGGIDVIVHSEQYPAWVNDYASWGIAGCDEWTNRRSDSAIRANIEAIYCAYCGWVIHNIQVGARWIDRHVKYRVRGGRTVSNRRRCANLSEYPSRCDRVNRYRAIAGVGDVEVRAARINGAVFRRVSSPNRR